ncbi:fimbria/pilus outer membrane usher protein [Enterovibrio coralii]|uniref:fimbria/pilus outer membrane usher protein n=1 Tax=Enterovibrio coralii TaxID=294935 RepID=UPI000A822AEC|nr:fimbria/pilus outer membrane usher protein [Enterovibrio coralii]
MNMGRRLSAVCLLMLASSSAMAMTFTVPLNMDGHELGMLPVSLSGMDVEAVSESELKAILGHRVAEKIWQVLGENKQIGNDGMVPLKALEAQGITLTFDASTLTMAAKISTKAFGQANVDFGEGFVPFVPTESSEFSWLNSLNFSHQESWQDSSNVSYTSFDWLAQFNIGGATGVNLDAANYLEISDGDAQVLRGEWTAFYDNPNAPYRFSLGDVESGVSGYLSNISMGGLSIESDYAELQPQRMVGPGNNQELILQESAEVEIEVNGQVIFSGRQEAGRFNLMNLPMVNGANDITVHVTYLSGKQETFVFTQFYNSNLLDKGMVNYAFTAGVPSVFADKGIDYTNTWAMTGFVEYGVSSSLTVGANGLAAKYGNLLGGLATVGTDWGNLSSRLSFSEYDHGDVGNILSFGFESAVIGASESQTPNLRLSAEFASDYITSPWEAEALPVSYDRYLANYMWSITEQWSATVSASYFDDDSDDAQTSTTSMLNWKNGDVTVGAGMTYTDSKAPETDETQYFLTLDLRWNHKKYGYSLGASYNTLANQSRVDISRANSDRVGGVGYRAMLEHDDNRDRENALLSYTANACALKVKLNVQS